MQKRSSKPTIEDVGRAAGVSHAAVSYVLTGSKHADRISAGTKARILAAAQQLGYAADYTAKALRQGYSNTVVVLVVMWDVASAHSLTAATLSRYAARYDLATIVHLAADDDEAADFLARSVSLNPYGVVLLWDSDAVSADHLMPLRARGVPIVDLMPPLVEGTVHVTSNREDAFRLSTRYLIDLGHKSIGIVLNLVSRRRTSNCKLAGYKDALRSAGIPFDEGLIEKIEGVDRRAGYHGLKRLIERRPEVTGVVCLSDHVANGAMVAAQDMGVKIPEQLSIVGYGAHAEGEFSRPALTTVKVPSAEIAGRAIEALVRQRQEPESVPRSVYAAVELIIRGSAGPAKAWPGQHTR